MDKQTESLEVVAAGIKASLADEIISKLPSEVSLQALRDLNKAHSSMNAWDIAMRGIEILVEAHKRSSDTEGTPKPAEQKKTKGCSTRQPHAKPVPEVTIYADGACLQNPGPGGWGALLITKDDEIELSGSCENTTNNRMELTGIIRALETLGNWRTKVDVYMDSQYVVNGIEKGWAKSWQKNGWKKADKKPAINPDLWEQLLDLCEKHDVRFHWVKGHADNEGNNRCDRMATREAAKAARNKYTTD